MCVCVCVGGADGDVTLRGNKNTKSWWGVVVAAVRPSGGLLLHQSICDVNGTTQQLSTAQRMQKRNRTLFALLCESVGSIGISRRERVLK